MTPGHPTADAIFEHILRGTASAHLIAHDTGTRELRHALAALSTFRGPGTFARDVAVALIRDELSEREGGQ